MRKKEEIDYNDVLEKTELLRVLIDLSHEIDPKLKPRIDHVIARLVSDLLPMGAVK